MSRPSAYCIMSLADTIHMRASKRCWILVLDSLGGTHKPVKDTLKKYLQQEAVDKLKAPSAEQVYLGKGNCEGLDTPVPTQHNYSDCGLYVMHFAETFLTKTSEVLHFVNLVSAMTSVGRQLKTRPESVLTDLPACRSQRLGLGKTRISSGTRTPPSITGMRCTRNSRGARRRTRK